MKFADLYQTLEARTQQCEDMSEKDVLANQDDLNATMESIVFSAEQLSASIELLEEAKQTVSAMDVLPDEGKKIVEVQLSTMDGFLSEEDKRARDTVLAEMVSNGASNKEVAMEAFGATVAKAFPLLKMLMDLLKRFANWIKKKMGEQKVQASLASMTAACKALNSQYGSDIINKPLSQLLGSSHPDKYELVQSAAKQLRLSTVTTSISGMDFMPITNKLEEIYLISKDASSTVEHVLSEIVDIATRFAGNGKVQEDMSREFKAAKSTLDKAIDKLCSGSTKSMRDVQDEDKFTRDTADVPTDARFYYAYQYSSGAAVWKNKDDSMGSIPLSYDVFSNIGIDVNITVAQMNAFSEALNRADISDKIDDLLRQASRRDSSAEKAEAKIARSLTVLNDTDPDIARNIRALLLALISYVKAVNVLTDMITSQITYVVDFCTRSLKIVQSAYAITK